MCEFAISYLSSRRLCLKPATLTQRPLLSTLSQLALSSRGCLFRKNILRFNSSEYSVDDVWCQMNVSSDLTSFSSRACWCIQPVFRFGGFVLIRSRVSYDSVVEPLFNSKCKMHMKGISRSSSRKQKYFNKVFQGKSNVVERSIVSVNQQ